MFQEEDVEKRSRRDLPDGKSRSWCFLSRYTISAHTSYVHTANNNNNMDQIISNQCVSNYVVTFKLPLQEQGVSMLESKSSS